MHGFFLLLFSIVSLNASVCFQIVLNLSYFCRLGADNPGHRQIVTKGHIRRKKDEHARLGALRGKR